MMNVYQKFGAVVALSGVFNMAQAFELSSTDISAGGRLTQQAVYNGFGCSGGNTSPALQWKNAPKGTEYFAITVFDPDAPTGSGWWHWQVVNIPKQVSSLPSGAGEVSKLTMPKEAMQMRNDFGSNGFGGACPPEGHGPHRYQFTVYALPQKLNIPQDASGALVGYMLNAQALATSSIEVLYERP
ncbi:YbhB/YbcL family Raf kinase inhibitor-like protein [Neisseriaceae bacterium CLB008]